MNLQFPTDFFSISYFTLIALIVMVSSVFLPASFHIAFIVLSLSVCISYCVIETQYFKKSEYSLYLFIPIALSAIQNILLGLFAQYCSKFQVQVLLSTNIIWGLILLASLVTIQKNSFKNNLVRRFFYVFVAFLFYAALSILFFGCNLLGLLSSLRNLISPLLFFLIGFLAAAKIKDKRLYLYLRFLGLFIIAFGFYERFLEPDLWKILNIDTLWDKKGLSNISSIGLPSNFYSSEKIGGDQIRRMASSYADPVNFGTNLFLVFIVSWISHKKSLLLLVVSSALVAISKGFLLGLLVFAVVFSYVKCSRTVSTLMALVAFFLGTVFVIYSLNHSTMSLVAHVFGFLASLKELPDYPFGRGIGNIGVLASQFTEITGTEITESGLGAIIGQMGVVGILMYTAFFISIHNKIKQLVNSDAKIAAYSLFFFIILNITFNEVALSPNSSAGIFMLLGLYAKIGETVNSPKTETC